MPQTTLFRQGTIEQDTLDELNAMLTELYGVTNVSGANGSATADYPKTTAGVQTLLASNAAARTVIISVEVTEVFANGDGTQPTFEIGETGTADKFAATSVFTGAALGTTFSFAGSLSADAAVIVTAVAATGTTSTGALRVTAIASAQ
jgi:hypothetical protein